MTSKFSIDNRELLQRISSGEAVVGIDFGNLIVRELAAFRLAAMDSEPVAWTWQHREHWHVTNCEGHARELAWDGVKVEPLYRHAQPAPVVQPMMFIDGDILSEDADKLAKVIREFNEEDERPLAKMARIIRENPHPTNECDMPKSQPQPAPVAPVCTCPSGDGSLRWPCPVHPGNSPVIPDGYVMVPVEPTKEILDEFDSIIDYGAEDSVDAWHRLLAAAPQSPGSEPATVPGEWIPVSEQMPPSRHEVLVGRWWGEKPRWCCKWAAYIPGHPDAQSSGWLIPGASWTPTHWMPLPAAPQEPKP